MVAVVSGNGLGLGNSSLNTMGSQGAVGNASEGKAGEKVYVNSTNGDLIIQDQDDLLSSLGLNLPLQRTYNSQGQLVDDLGGNWRLGVNEHLANLTGTIYAAGSTVTRVLGDESEVLYVFDTTRQAYVAAGQSGAHDELTFDFNTNLVTWHDGTTGATETYDTNGQLLSAHDADGNSRTYHYTGNLLTSITDASGQTVNFDYSGNNLTQVRVVSQGVTQTLTHYFYDSQNRLSQVKVDLSPADNAIGDGDVYATTYTYDGASSRITSISRSDGTSVSFTYQLINGAYEVKTYTTEGHTTTLSYVSSSGNVVSLPANSNALSTTDTVTQTHSLNTDALSGSGAISFVQGAVGNPQWITVDSVDVPLTSATAAGDFNVVAIGWNDSTNTLTSITDTNGNVYTRAVGPTINNGYGTQVIYYAKNVSGAAANANTISVTFSGQVMWADVRVAQYHGIDPTNPFDGAVGAAGDGTSPDSGPLTTTHSSDLLIAANYVADITTDVGGGFAIRQEPENGDILADQIVSAAGTYDASSTVASSGWWIMQMAAFKAASTGTAYYTIPSGATWQSIASALYGVDSAAAGSALQTAMGNPPLTAGNHLTGMPATLSVAATQTVPAYYVVPAGATWASITQAVYGTSDAAAVAALQTATGGPALTTGLHLTVPLTLSYTVSGSGGTGQTDITDALGQTTTYYSDNSGRVTSILSPIAGATRLRVDYTYDADGNVTSVAQDPAGLNRVTTMTYDANGNLILTRDPLGDTVARTYSATNKLLTETRYLTPDPDGAGPGLPAGPTTTRHAYDSEGHLRFSVSADGRVSENRYNTQGQLVARLQYTSTEYDVSSLSPTDTVSESQLATWAATAQNVAKVQRTDYTYDFRGNLSTTTTYASTDASGAGIPASGSVTHYVYDQRGLLLQEIDPRATSTSPAGAFTTSYVYDGLGRVTSKTVWDSVGVTTTTTTHYDDAGGKTVVTFANGLVSTSTYNHANQLLGSTNTGPDSQDLGTTTYAYDADDRLRMVIDANGNRSYVLYDTAGRKVADIDADGEMTEYVYDNLSNLVETIAYSQRLSAATIATLVDQSGKPATIALATLKTSIGRGSGPDLSTDRVSINVYDAAGRLSAKVDGTGSVTGYTHDGLGRVTEETQYFTRVTVPAGTDPTALGTIIPVSNRKDRVTQYFYDDDGHRIGMVDADEYLTEYIYDAAGQLSRQTAYAFQANEGTTLDEVRPDPESNDITTRYFYDGQGRRIGMLDGVGYLTETLYDAAGNVSQQIRYDSVLNFSAGDTVDSLRPTGVTTHTTSYVYDGANRLIQETNFEGTAQSNEYDSVGDLVSSTSAAGTTEARTSQTRYDALGRVIAQLTPAGSNLITAQMTQAQIDAIWNQYSVRYAYDATGKVISTTDQNNNTTLFYYDAEGRKVFTVNAAGDIEERRYDAFSEVTNDISYSVPELAIGLTGGVVTSQLTSLVTAASAAPYSQTTTTYTVLGQVRSVATAEGSLNTSLYDVFGDKVQQIKTVNGGTSESDYQYDAMDRVVSVTADKLGINAQKAIQYDAFGRVVITYLFNNNSNTIGVSTDYDQLGRVIRSYDGFDNIEQTTYDAFSRVQAVQDRLGNTTTYTYDDSGRSVIVTTPEGVSTQTVHNRDGSVHSVTKGGLTTSYAYDLNGRQSGVSDNLGLVESRNYDQTGLLLSVTDGNAIVTAYTYDAANRVKTKTQDAGTGNLNLVTTYTYDGEGRTTQVDEPGGKSTVTQYDRDGRIVQVEVDKNGLDLTTTYAYDVAGNVITKTEGANSSTPRRTSYEYDNLGRRTAEIVDPTALGGTLNLTTQYKYDNVGNLTRKIDPDGFSTWFIYDGDNRLIQTIDATGGLSETKYDADGRVVSTTRHFDAINQSLGDSPDQIIPSYSSADRVEQFIYDRDGRQIYAINSDGAVTERVFDDNGNATRVRTYSYSVRSQTYATIDDIRSELLLTRGDIDTVMDTDRVSWATYDLRGQAVFTVDSLGDVVQNQYDGAGNVTATTAFATRRPTGQTTLTSIDLDTLRTWATSHASSANDRTTLYWYDGVGRIRFVQDPMGFVRETRYDDIAHTQTSIAYGTATSLAPGSRLAQVISATQSIPANQQHVAVTQFDKAGRVIGITDAALQTQSYTYDALGNKTSYTNQSNATWTYHYDAAGRLTRQESPAVLITSTSAASSSVGITSTTAPIVTAYTYDGRGNVKSQTVSGGGAATPVTTSYDYDGLGRQTRVYQPSVGWYNAAADNINATGTNVTRTEFAAAILHTEVDYDALGNAFRSQDVNGNYSYKTYDTEGRLIYAVDADHYVTGYTYDAFGNQTSITRYANPIAAVPAWTFASDLTPDRVEAELSKSTTTDRTITSIYDAVGRVIEVLGPPSFNYEPDLPGNDPAAVSGSDTTTEYNAFGDVIASIQGLARGPVNFDADSFFYYDRNGRKTATVDALGYLTTYHYDGFGNLQTQTEYAKAVSGSWESAPGAPLATSASDPAGDDRITAYLYDSLNRKTSETLQNYQYNSIDNGVLTAHAGGRTTTYGYDAVGNVTRVTQPGGASTYTFYDALGRVIGVAGPRRDTTGGLALGSDSDTEFTPYTDILRDVLGNVVVQIQRVNDAGDLSTLPPGSAPPAVPDNDGDRKTVYVRDSLGRIIQTQDPLSVQTFASYTASGQIAKQWQYTQNNDGVVEAIVTIHQYDALGQETDVIQPQISGTVAVDTRSRYNAFGEVDAKAVFQAGTTLSAYQDFFSFDQAGHLWRSYTDGFYTIYYYNLQGQVTRQFTVQDVGVDLGSYASVQGADALPAKSFVDTVYDKDGRVVQQRNLHATDGFATILKTNQTLDRWGNAISLTDSSGNTTTHRYDGLNHQIQTTLPVVTVVDTRGQYSDVQTAPVMKNFFDLAGNQIETDDGNGNATRYFYNSAGQVLIQQDADSSQYANGAFTRNTYDSFGELLEVVDQLGYRTRNRYDKDGRLTRVDREIVQNGFIGNDPSDPTPQRADKTATVSYQYDDAGRRRSSTDANNLTTSYWYDLLGNVVKMTTPMGHSTTYKYNLRGQKTQETDANGTSQIWGYSPAGVLMSKVEMQNSNSAYGSLSGTQVSYVYDHAGHIIEAVSSLGQDTRYNYDQAGYLSSISDGGTSTSPTTVPAANSVIAYTYDNSNRVVEESTDVDGRTQNDTITSYDALGRIESLSDLDDYQLTYNYDAAGNRTTIFAAFRDHNNVLQNQTLYYTYDQDNRVLKSQGLLTTVGGQQVVTVNNVQGEELTYDAKGQRASARTAGKDIQEIDIVQGVSHVRYEVSEIDTADLTATQTYAYDGLGRLTTVSRSMTFLTYDQSTGQYVGSPQQEWVAVDEKVYDKGSRVTDESHNTPTGSGFDAQLTETLYNDDGQATTQTTKLNGTTQAVVTYGSAVLSGGTWSLGYDKAGILRAYSVDFYSNGVRQYTSRHDLSYQLGGAYQQTAEDVNSTRISGGTVPVPTHGHTDRMYNVAGELVKESDINAPDTTRYFANDATGHVLTEIQGNFDGASGHLTLAQAWDSALAHTSGDAQKAQYFFYTNGSYVGSFGQIQSGGQFVANFDVNYTPVSAQYPASTPSTVVAQSGDTLRILASRIYGDANLWYIIAQSNGLTNPDATITVGTTLIVPNQVASLSNTSSSFKPFDLSQAMGDTTPVQPLPPPPSHGGCGVLGTVLILVVAIIVTVYSAGLAASVIAPAATAAGGAVGTASLGAAALTGSLVGASGATLVGTSIAAAAIGGAVGSIVSQGIGVAIGAQDSFSWKNVALGAVGAGVGAGLAGSSQVGDLLAGLGKGSLAAEAAADSAITQGIGVTTGLQSSFSWRQVAESAIAAPIAASAGGYVGQQTGSTFAGQFASGVTGSLVRQAVGGKVNMTSVLTDAFGNALGNSVAAAATTPTAFDEVSQQLSAEVRTGEAQVADQVSERVSDTFAARIADSTVPYATLMGFEADADEAVQSSAAGLNASLNRSIQAETRAAAQINFPDSSIDFDTSIDPVDAAEYAKRSGQGVDFMSEQSAAVANGAPAGIDLSGVRPFNSVRGLPRAVSSIQGMPAQSGYQIVENREVVEGAPSDSVAYYTAYNANLHTTDYVIGPHDLQSFLDRSLEYSLDAQAARAPDYMKESFASVNSAMNGDLDGWLSHLGGAYSAAVRDPNWLAQMGTSIAGGVMSAAEVAGAGSGNIVYRGLTAADAESIQAGGGIVAKAPNGTWTAAEHVANSGPGAGGAGANSPWVSTSKLLDVAESYDSGYGVVAIDLNKVDSLQVEVWRTAPRVNGVNGLAFQRSFWGQEVTIYKTIPPEAILGKVH